MTRILHVIHGLNLGGAENFIYNLLGAIDRERFRFDFAIQEPEIKHRKFKELIEERGGTIYIIPDFTDAPFRQAKALKSIMLRKYDCVHIHMNAFINPIPAIVASKFDCKVIIHSHSTQNGRGGLLGKFVHILNKSMFLKDRFIRLSCSREATRWMFGNRSAQVISNAIDVAKFAFSPDYRNRIREKFNLTDEFVVGQVGRLIPLKNQTFSIQVMRRLKETHPRLKAKLMLIGEGPSKDELERLALETGVGEDVIFVGAVHNVNEYYSAFDAFVMPSWFEGLGLVSVEAQAAGLKSLVSDTVTREVDITDSVEFLSLKKIDEWTEGFLKASKPYDRSLISNRVKESAFDSVKMAETMERIYER